MSGAIAEPQKAKANQTVSTFFSSQDVFELLLSLYIEKKNPDMSEELWQKRAYIFCFRLIKADG